MTSHFIRCTTVAAVVLGGLWLSPLYAGGEAKPTPAAEVAPTGPHGGRLLRDGDRTLELALIERGMPPEYRAWLREGGDPVPPEAVHLEVELERLGGTEVRIAFSPVDDFLRGDRVVAEPHAFDVTVRLRYQGADSMWQFAVEEGRTRIPHAIAKDAGVTVEEAGPATLHRTLSLSGRVQADPDRVARVAAPYPGEVTRIEVEQYARVERGQPLATVVARDSLRPTVLKAPFAGIVLQRHAALGQQAGSEVLFEIADLRRVWVMLDAFARDLPDLAVGQAVSVQGVDDRRLAEGALSHISPTSGQRQNVHLRVPVDNPDGRLRPGQFVQAEVLVEAREVPLAVRRSALQRYREREVVFARYGDLYEVRLLELGARDDTWVEVVDGITPGTAYVTGNSFLIRADMEKGGASHDH